MHKWVFPKAEIAQDASISEWKTHKCKLIHFWTRKTIWLLINSIHSKNLCWRSAGRCPLKLCFPLEKTIFKVFHTKFLSWSFYVIALAKKSSFCLSANHKPELWCVIYTGVTLFALVLHLNRTALKHKNWVIFLCILLLTTLIPW